MSWVGGPGGSLYSEVPSPGVGAQEGPCTVKSHVLGWGPGGSLYSEIPFLGMGSLYSEVPCMGVGPEPAGSLYIKVQYNMGNGHTAPSPQNRRQTDTCENITFLQFRWTTVIRSEWG